MAEPAERSVEQVHELSEAMKAEEDEEVKGSSRSLIQGLGGLDSAREGREEEDGVSIIDSDISEPLEDEPLVPLPEDGHSGTNKSGRSLFAGKRTEEREMRPQQGIWSSTPADAVDEQSRLRFSTNGAQRGAPFDGQGRAGDAADADWRYELVDSTVTFPRYEERRARLQPVDVDPVEVELVKSLREQESLRSRLTEELQMKEMMKRSFEMSMREQEQERELFRRDMEDAVRRKEREQELEKELYKRDLEHAARCKEREQELEREFMKRKQEMVEAAMRSARRELETVKLERDTVLEEKRVKTEVPGALGTLVSEQAGSNGMMSKPMEVSLAKNMGSLGVTSEVNNQRLVLPGMGTVGSQGEVRMSGLESKRVAGAASAEVVCVSALSGAQSCLSSPVAQGTSKNEEPASALKSLLGDTDRSFVQAEVVKQMMDQFSQMMKSMTENKNVEKPSEKSARVVVEDTANDSMREGEPRGGGASSTETPASKSSGKEKGFKRRRDDMKLEKFNGQSDTWAAFLMELENCAVYNHWDDDDKLAQLKHALKGNANQVLWTDAKRKWTYDELVETLTRRFGNDGQMAMYRSELNGRRKGKNETYQALQQDIRRLMFLAYDDPQSKTSIACAVDAYIRAFDNRDIAEKVQELDPKDLDEALRHALRFDAYAKNRAAESRDVAGRNRRDEACVRMVTNDTFGSGDHGERETEMQRIIREVMEQMKSNAPPVVASGAIAASQGGMRYPAPMNVPPCGNPGVMQPMWFPFTPPMQPVPVSGPVTQRSNESQVAGPDPNAGGPSNQGQRNWKKSARCFNCNEEGHFAKFCPLKNQVNMIRVRDESARECREIGSAREENRVSHTYLRMMLYGKEHVCLLDSGSVQTVVPPEVAVGLPLRRLKDMRMTAANGNRMTVYGEVDVPFMLQGMPLPAASLVSPEVDEILIGADWLQRYRVQWNFGEREVVIQSVRVTLEDGYSRYLCRRVVSEMSVYIPPRQEMIISARYVLMDEEPVSTRRWSTEEMELDVGLMVQGVELPDKECGLPVLMRNSNDYAVWVGEGYDVAVAIPIGCETGVMIVRSPSIAGNKEVDTCDTGGSSSSEYEDALSQPEVRDEREVRVIDVEVASEFAHVDSLVENVEGVMCPGESDQLRELLRSYADVFSASKFDLGVTDLAKHSINTGDARPVKQMLRQQPRAQLQSIDDQTREMEEAGLIEPSQSPWVSNVVMVTKKDGTPRFCIDYRRLNELTVKDAYPLPKIETCLDALGGARFFSTFDLRSGYHQVMMDPRDADKTSFVTRTGTYRFKVLPFGLCNAGATFQRVMDVAMRGLNFKICLVYLDDIIVYSKTLGEHMKNLAAVLQRLREAGLKLKPSKCKLVRTRVEFLGHVVSEQGISTDPAKIKDILDWPVPQNVTEVRSFVGLASYYRRFVPDFSVIAVPLHKLMKKNARFYWNEECEAAMRELQNRLASSPVLAMPDDDGEYTLDTDASEFAIGAILSQNQNGEEKVIAYTSRTLHGPELNYCVTRKELLAVVYFSKYFRQYLLGRKFRIRTDHAALQWLQKTPTPIGQQARWLDILGGFDFDVIHRPGKTHQNADALSRKPCRQCGVGETEQSDEEKLSRLCAINLGDVSSVPDSPWSVEEMEKDTLSDPDLKVVVGWMDDPSTKPEWDETVGCSATVRVLYKMMGRMKMYRGTLYRQWYHADGTPSHWQIVVPESRRLEFVRLAHEGGTGGHLGVKKTFDQVQRRAFWPGLNRDVDYVLKRCPECVSYHRGKLPRKGLLQPMKVGETWDRVSIDVTGPHPKSKSGKTFILTMMDHHTKWAEAFAVPNHEAVTVAKILTEQVFPRFGAPKQILSDRGTEFEGKLMTELCRAMGIDKLKTTAYKPSTNGAVERFHRTLNSMIGKVVSENQRDWDECLPTVMAAYRATKHEATGFTPNCLMLGREVRAPLDLVFDVPESQEDLHDSYDDFVFAYQRRSRYTHRLVREHLRRAAERSKDYYDVRVRPSPFRVGSWVYFYSPRRFQGRSPKWQRLYSGPYLVVEVKGPVNVVIQLSARAKPFIVHVDKLKLWLGDHPVSWIRPLMEIGRDGDGKELACVEQPPAVRDDQASVGEREDDRVEDVEGSVRDVSLDGVRDSVSETMSDGPSNDARDSGLRAKQEVSSEDTGGAGADEGGEIENDDVSLVVGLEEIREDVGVKARDHLRRNVKKPARYAARTFAQDGLTE